ncbi:MAG: C4-dicarboxylate ABC transporter [Thalassospira sp.]|uniref:TRAP transporter substrate-binding protein DctP n=1 Tax=Thalassospira sp. TaxID=1912094 RepID=UPI000C661C1D|nr:TRAP transporter substrate-binding protein DctP [Thalassospira sp.]MAZ31932.1 C4-dicarboxylate ABC transporter [Thalassospira sp.]
MKNFVILVFGFAAVLASPVMAQAQDHVMRISHQFPPTHHTAIRLEKFAEDVETATEGAVDVQIFGSAQLYKPQQNHAAVASGEIEAAAIVNLQWGGTIPEMAVTVIPYLMTSPQAQKSFIGSEASEILDGKMAERGVQNIGWIVDTNDLIFTSSKGLMVKPEDFQGVKIRGLTPLFDEGLKALGATPVQLPGSEVYQALQTAVIDAGVTGVSAAFTRKFYEVQDYGTASPIFVAFDNLVVNPAWWNDLPEGIRTAIQTAADAAVESSIITYDGINPDDVTALTGAGMKVHVLNDAEISVLREIMQPAVKEAFLAETGEDGEKLISLISAE